jgi:hypothetical protein
MMARIPLEKFVGLMNTLKGRSRNVTLITELEAATRFNCSVPTIREWTRAGILPTPVKLARDKTYYCLEEINQKFASGRSYEKAN